MRFDKDAALALYDNKIYLALNTAPPNDEKYGWLKLPADIPLSGPVRIEERTGIYGGPYYGSIGAPNYPGFCDIRAFSYTYSPLPYGLRVGRYCSISAGLIFLDSHHPTDLITTSALSFRPGNNLWSDIAAAAELKDAPNWHIYNYKRFPVIGNDVWIGRNVVLAMGITIGDGAIIAANSVVTKDVPPYTLVAGNPAQVKKTRFAPEIVDRLLASGWWERDPVEITRLVQAGVEKSLDYLEAHPAEIGPYLPRTLILSNTGIEVGAASVPTAKTAIAP